MKATPLLIIRFDIDTSKALVYSYSLPTLVPFYGLWIARIGVKLERILTPSNFATISKVDTCLDRTKKLRNKFVSFNLILILTT